MFFPLTCVNHDMITPTLAISNNYYLKKKEKDKSLTTSLLWNKPCYGLFQSRDIVNKYIKTKYFSIQK